MRFARRIAMFICLCSPFLGVLQTVDWYEWFLEILYTLCSLWFIIPLHQFKIITNNAHHTDEHLDSIIDSLFITFFSITILNKFFAAFFCFCCCSSFTEKLNLFVLSKKQRPFLGPPWNATHLYVTVNYIVNRIVCDMVDFISSLAATAQFVRLIVFGKTRFGERARVARVSYRSDDRERTEFDLLKSVDMRVLFVR